MASGNPTLPTLSEAEASALSNTIHAATGTRYIKHAWDEDDTPPIETKLTERENWVNGLIEGMATGGKVKRLATALTIGVLSCQYTIGGVDKSFAGETGLLLSANNTHYVYLDSAATLQTSTSAFPADVFRVAIVVTDATDITSVTDVRMQNADVGGTNAWYNVPAQANVNVNNNKLKEVKGVWYGDEIATIAAGDITPSSFSVRVRTEAAAATDDLDGMIWNEVDLVVLKAYNPATEVVTIKPSATLKMPDGDFTLDSADKAIMFRWDASLNVWQEVARNKTVFSALAQNLDAAGFDLTNVGLLNLNDAVDVTLASDALTITGQQSYIRVLSEAGGGNPDDLQTITGGSAGDILVLTTFNAVITVKTSGGNINLQGGANDYVMDTFGDTLVLIRSHTADLWYELCRTKRSLADLVPNCPKAVPYSPTGMITGALAAGVQAWHFYAPFDFVIRDVAGVVKTAPSGGSAIVDVQVNGSSIFASEAEMINIADGNTSDVSATKNHAVSATDIVRIEVKTTGGSPNGAADLTVTINGAIALQTAP